MASPFQNGDEEERSFEPYPPPLPPAEGYFSQPAMRGAPMGFDAGMRPSLEALEMELREERIREEIIARRISQRRMVEEQARREMEMAMAMRMEMEFGDRRGFVVGKRSALLPEVEMVEEAPEDIEFGKRDVEFEERERLAKPRLKMNDKIIPPKLLATKRKAPAAILGTSISKFPRLAQKEWSCALCQVSTTSQDDLNKHLQGKKHQSKAAQLAPKKNLVVTELAKNSGSSSGGSSSLKQKVTPKKKPISKGARKVSIQVGEKLHEVSEKGHFLRCWMCKVKCNGKSAMISHLSGKRHLLEESKKAEASEKGTMQNKKDAEVVDKGTSQHEEVAEVMDKGISQHEEVVEEKKECTEEPEAVDKGTSQHEEVVEVMDKGISQHEEVVEEKKECTEEPEQPSGSKDTPGSEE